jgi:hypothetical protein
MERYLEAKGTLDTFHIAFKEASGTDWIEERDAYPFHRDEVVKAWSAATGQSKEAADKWIDGSEESFALTVENFCRWVKDYLDKQGPDHRLIFLVDEVGQFIGNDTHLMLNLQTITEDLGTVCQGRAWVVVTSQEDIDAVLGEMRTSRANDFSKIQGRFKTRLSLSSANVDEVIQERLLAKKSEVVDDLQDLFRDKGDILRHQLTFTNCGMTFRQYRNADDFVNNYPFAPYQFQLVQRIFEAIRRAGATGLHLSRGERSILDAFQLAGKRVANKDIGVLVPLYEFYPSIESFLDTVVKRTIDQAADSPSLEPPLDVQLLQVLFLIRYVDEMKGNVDNLVTLCLDQIDGDRLALKRRIEESLQRLERETLISRSGDNYFFLTNEERDINQEIKNVDLSSGEEAKLLGDLIFEEVLRGQRKHRYAANKMDFTFNRFCDGFPAGNRADGALVVSVITPLHDEYEVYTDQKCVLESTQDDGQVLLQLDDNESLDRELRAYLRTDKYLKTKNDGTLPTTTRRIHHDLAADNRARWERLINLLKEMMVEGRYFVSGQRLQVKATTPQAALDEALEYLITNTFTKMNYLKRVYDTPEHARQEIQAVLRSNDIAQQTLAIQQEENNPQAIEDLRNYVDLCAKASRQIVLHDLIDKRYGVRPYGWPEHEVLLLVARLLVLGEISLMMDGALIPLDKVYESITTSSRQRRITIMQRKMSDPKALQSARNLGKDVFSDMGPDGEDTLFAFLRRKLEDWQSNLSRYKTLADTGDYPGQDEIADSITVIRALLACTESYTFIERFNERKDDLLTLSDDYHDLEHFYEHQKPTWDKLRKAYTTYVLNRSQLDQDEKAAPALRRIHDILSAKSPYGLIKEAEGLITTVGGINSALITEYRTQTIEKIDAALSDITRDFETAKGDDTLHSDCLEPLKKLRSEVERQESIAHITQAEHEVVPLFDAAQGRIQAFVRKAVEVTSDEDNGPDTSTPKPVVRTVRPIRPATLVKTAYLETQQDVDHFLDALKHELEDAIAKNERIQIR